MAHSAISQSSAALSGIPSQSTPLPVKPGYRLVPATVGRPGQTQTILVECPAWCVVDHAAERVAFIEDLNHSGERRGICLTPSRGDRVPLEVYLAQWPGSSQGNDRPYLAVDLDYEVTSYGRTAAMALADQLVAFAADVRRLAEMLPDDSPAAGRSQADEALRRVRSGRSA